MPKFLKSTTYILLGLFISIFFLRRIETGDIWWHISTGRYILQTGSIPQFDPFSFGKEAVPWVIHHWFGSCIFYLVYVFFGYAGLSCFRALLFLLICSIVYIYGRRKVPDSWLAVLIFILCFGLGLRAHLRPYLFNFVFIQLFLILLYRHRDRTQLKPLLWLPLLTVFWSNIHMGSFVYGNIILIIFFCSYVLEFYKTRRLTDQPPGRQIRRIKHLGLILALCLIATIINPSGLTGLLHPMKIFFLPDYIHFYDISSNEMNPPGYLFTPLGIWAHILIALSLIMLFMDKRDLVNILLFITALFMFFYAKRGAAFFAIVSTYVIINILDLKMCSAWWSTFPRRKKSDIFIYLTLIMLLSLNIIRTYNKTSFYNGHFEKRIQPLSARLQPTQALPFLQQHRNAGTIFNSSIYGGYLIWNAYNDLHPFIDTRQINLPRSFQYINILHDPGRFWPSVEEQFHFEFALLNAKDPNTWKLIDYLNRQDIWELAMLDGVCLVFANKNLARVDHGSDNLAALLEDVKLTEFDFNKILTKPLPRKNFLEKFINPAPYFIDFYEQSLILYHLGFRKAAISSLVNSITIYDSIYCRNLLIVMLESIGLDFTHIKIGQTE